MFKQYQAVVVGGSIGGVLASYSLAKQGIKTLLIEKTSWVGGQFTNQGVPSDEHDFIESTGATASYHQFREDIRAYYRNHPMIIDDLKNRKVFCPGNAWVSRIAADPRVILNIMNKMLAPFVQNSTLEIMLNTVVITAENIDDEVMHIVTEQSKKQTKIKAVFFLDATDTGELLPLTKTAYVTGAESFAQTGEPDAPIDSNPLDMQPITWTAAIAFDKKNTKIMKKPDMYEFFKKYQMPFGDALLSWYAAGLERGSKREYSMFANPPFQNTPAMFTYRQVIEKNNFKNNFEPYSIMILNWPQNDYFFDNIFEVSCPKLHEYLARQLTFSLVYWLQTEALRDDGKGFGYKEIKLVPEVLGTSDGLAMAPYIRESRRIKALYTIKEQNISKRHAKGPTEFSDSIGVGHYHIDLHMTTKTNTYFFDETWPFQIPLGSLIPIKTKNLIACCKNIGTTHLTNSCYRLHPIEWNIGESAGLLVAFCIKHKILPKTVYKNKDFLREYQALLVDNGIQLQWPKSILGG